MGVCAAYTKLHVWNLVEYEKVVYVDADAMMVDNIDEVCDSCLYSMTRLVFVTEKTWLTNLL